MVGRLPDAARAGRLGFAQEGDAIAIAGRFAPSLAASELAKLRGEPLPDGLAEVDMAVVAALQEAIREAVRSGALTSSRQEGTRLLFGSGLANATHDVAGRMGRKSTPPRRRTARTK